MKKIFLLALFTISFNTFAEDLACSVNLNTVNVTDVEVTVGAQEKVLFADLENGFRFYINNKGNSKFEIEVVNNDEQTRSYADGKLQNLDEEVSWSIWSRDYMIDSTCKLIKK